MIPGTTRRGRHPTPTTGCTDPVAASTPAWRTTRATEWITGASADSTAQRQPLPAASRGEVVQPASDPGVGEGLGHKPQGPRSAAQRSREMGSQDVRPVPPRRHRRRRRQVRADRADLPGDGQLRRRRRDGRRAGQHLVLRGGLRRKQEQGRAVSAHHDRTVRRHRSADRSRARPPSARPEARTGHVVRAAHGARGDPDRQLRRRDGRLPVVGALPVRAGNDGAVQVIQRAAQRRDAARAAADDRPGAGEFAAHRVRSARRDDRRRRGGRRGRVPVEPVRHAGRAVRRRRADAGRRRTVDADPQMGRGHRGRGAHHVELPRRGRRTTPPPTALTPNRAVPDSRWAATSSPRCGATARSR